jgi:uncharacterized coiled-coil protein SlyX
MTPDEAQELSDWLRELWSYVLDLTDHITALGERINELEHRSADQ